ncbi:hypothetical protein BDQ17DRAFT_1254539 [Cyathus striatus]|nr:hypothetical protein BDQ17DRAFT_1254539 [Cyathus striatus]
MAAIAPSTDLWLERSRLAGIILASFSYGIFFILSVQACQSIVRGMRSRGTTALRSKLGFILLGYVILTFLLGSIGMGANARYTEDIWINYQAEGRTPVDLIINEFEFWYNRMAIDSHFILVWVLDMLLFYRCVVIWNYQLWVIILMGSIFLSIIGITMSIMVLAGRAAVFTGLQMQTAFLAMSVSYNFLFTFLVCAQLFMVRRRMRDVLGREQLIPYTSITATLVESTSLYLIVELIYLFAFAFHSHVQNLLLMENAIIQAISQLLIILRVAQGRDYNTVSMTIVVTDRCTGGASSEPITFRHTVRREESRIVNESLDIEVIIPKAIQSEGKDPSVEEVYA